MVPRFFRAAVLAAAVLCSCGTAGPPSPVDAGRDLVESALTVLRVVGDVVLRVEGAAALRRYAPEAMALVDQPTRDAAGAVTAPPDGVLTIAELEAAAKLLAERPEVAAGVLAAAWVMRRAER